MPSPNGLSLLGVNLSGGEYGKPTATNPGKLWTDYVLPSTAELDYYAGKGMNVIRLPFLWERMQPVLGGALNATFLAQVDQVVAYANAKGMKVDLDVHNYGNYYGKPVGGADVPVGALAELWGRLAGHFKDKDVLFGLMNEPSTQAPSDWAAIVQGAVTAIRAAGAVTQEILVPGTRSDTASSWVKSGNAAALLGLSDPGRNMAFEVHEYLDGDESGRSTAVSSPLIGAQRLAAVTQWAEGNGVRLFLGEFGSGSDSASLAGLDGMLGYMAAHPGAWQGATYWAGGQWWGAYPFSIEPSGGVDKPQMGVLARYERVTALPGFDPQYYLAHNPDVATARMDPLQHYLAYGWHENRNPDAAFDGSYYLAQNVDVRAAGVNPLLHFLQSGWAEGRVPSLVFDPARYLLANPDVAAAGMNPVAHYASYGQAEGREAFLVGGSRTADPLVSAPFLAAQLGASLVPGGVAGAQQASFIYDTSGWRAGLNPSPWFDTDFYLQHYPDVAAAHMDPLVHYETYGWHEGRDPSAAFSTRGYLAANADVRAAGMDPLLHYAMYGQAEGRSAFAA